MDLPDEYAAMGNEELLALFTKEHGEFMHYLTPTIIRSGGGLHIYVKIDTVDLTDKDNVQLWKHTMSNLNFLLRDWGADIKCIDSVRILRPPCTRNRKEKYGANGKEVVLLRNGSAKHTLDEVEQIADYLLQGGDRQIFESICDSLMMDIYCNEEDDEDYVDEFIPIEFDDDIFTGPLPKITTNSFPTLPKSEPKEVSAATVEKPITKLQTKTTSVSTGCKFNDSYMGICIDYKDIPVYEFWQNRDMLFFIKNRSTTEGIRNNMLFFFGYNWYHFAMVRNFKEFQEKCLWLNKNYFKPSLPEREILYHIPYLFKKFQSHPKSKYIKCQTLLKYINVSEEEKKFTRGNYYEKGTPEYETKRKIRLYKANRRYRDKKGLGNNIEKIENAKKYINENPYVTYPEAKEDAGVCEETYYQLRKEIWKEKGITYDDYLSPFRDNPDISYEEYHKLRSGSRQMYTKYKNRFLKS